jgi:hypothetical protein
MLKLAPGRSEARQLHPGLRHDQSGCADDRTRDGPLTLKAFRAIASQQAGLAAFTIGLTTVDDHMALTIGYTEPLVASSSATAFAGAMLAALRSGLDSP